MGQSINQAKDLTVITFMLVVAGFSQAYISLPFEKKISARFKCLAFNWARPLWLDIDRCITNSKALANQYIIIKTLDIAQS